MSSRFDFFLAYAESHRRMVTAAALALIAVSAWLDWLLINTSVGFLYLLPILLSAAALRHSQILAMALFCGYLREALDPAQEAPQRTGWALLHGFNPASWAPGSGSRL